MNYIKEINAFYDTIERKPLSASAVTLWHALMHINNKARWKETFTVAQIVLQFKAGLTDSSFKRARTELAEKDYITCESQERGQAPIYQLTPLAQKDDETTRPQDKEEETHQDTNPNSNHNLKPQADPSTTKERDSHTHQITEDTSKSNPQETPKPMTNKQPNPSPKQNTTHPATPDTTNHPTDPNMDPNTNHQPAPLVKQNKKKPNQTKQNNNNHQQADAILFYSQNFGTASPFVSESILHWTNDIPEELIIHAMERALEQGKAHWGYVKGILQAWAKKDIHTVPAAKADALAFKNRTQHPKAQPPQEVIPAWFAALEEQKKATTNNKSNTQQEAVILAETQELLDACQ